MRLLFLKIQKQTYLTNKTSQLFASGHVDVIPLFPIYRRCQGSCACKDAGTSQTFVVVISINLFEMRKTSSVIQSCGQ